MSSGGPINMTAILDLTKPYADLAAFRTAAAQPVAIGAAPMTPGVNPATFGNPGGTPFPSAQVIGAYARLTGSGPVMLGHPFGAGNQSSGGGGAEFTAAVSQLNLAAQAMRQAANAIQGAGGAVGEAGEAGDVGGGMASGAGGGRGRVPIFARGFARVLSGAFIAREAIKFSQDVYSQNTQEQLAARIGDNSPLHEVERRQKFMQSIYSIPFFGWGAQIAGIAGGFDRRAEFRKQDIEEGIKDSESIFARDERADASELKVRSTVRGARSLRVVGEYGRGIQRSVNTDIAAQEAYESQRASRQRRLDYGVESGSDDAREHRRKYEDLEQFKESSEMELRAGRIETEAQRKESTRILVLHSGELRRETGVLSLRARGLPGAAGELEFENSLILKQQEARERGGAALEFTQVENNKIARVARREEINFDIDQRRDNISALAYDFARDPYNAGLARIQSRGAKELRAARPGTPEAAVIRQENLAEQAIYRQNFIDNDHLLKRRLDDSIAKIDISNDLSLTPAERELKGRIREITSHAKNAKEDAVRSGHSDQVGRIDREARGLLQHERIRLLDSIEAMEVDPSRTALSGPGTFNLGAAFNEIGKGEKRLPGDEDQARKDALPSVEEMKDAFGQALANFPMLQSIEGMLRQLVSPN